MNFNMAGLCEIQKGEQNSCPPLGVGDITFNHEADYNGANRSHII